MELGKMQKLTDYIFTGYYPTGRKTLIKRICEFYAHKGMTEARASRGLELLVERGLVLKVNGFIYMKNYKQ